MARWVVGLVILAGALAVILGGCAPAPPAPAALGAATPPAPTAVAPPPALAALTPTPTSSATPRPTPSPTEPPILPTQPVPPAPLPPPRTPLPTPSAAAPRVIVVATPSRFMDDAAFGERARADLAGRLRVAPDTVEVVSVTRDEVPIGVFNCTARRTPGKVPYTQPALVTAVEIVLRAGGREVTYYAQGQRLVTCDAP